MTSTSPAKLPSPLAEDEARRTLGFHLKGLRERRKLRQAELHKATGASTPWISRIERGHVWPSDEFLRRAAQVLKVDADELLSYARALRNSEQSGIGRLIAERMSRTFGNAEPLLPQVDQLPETTTKLTAPAEVAHTMVGLLAAAEKADPQTPILICRYTREDVLDARPHLLATWGVYLQAVMAKGWDVEHVRSEAAWEEEMRRLEVWQPGGPLSILDRIGFDGDYRPYAVPVPASPIPGFNLMDVPGHGTVFFSPTGLGCFIPEPDCRPLAEVLRAQHLKVIGDREPLVRRHSLEAGREELELQRIISDAESVPGNRILVKDGLGVDLEPPEVLASRLERLRLAGRVATDDLLILRQYYERRRSAFSTQLDSSWEFLDLTSRAALLEFTTTGKTSSDPENLRPAPEDIRAAHIFAALKALAHENYSLAVVDDVPFGVRCLMKDSPVPLVFLEVAKGSIWAEFRDPVFCSSLMTHMRQVAEPSADKENVRGILAELAAQCSAATGPPGVLG